MEDLKIINYFVLFYSKVSMMKKLDAGKSSKLKVSEHFFKWY